MREQEAVFKEASLQCVQNCVLDLLETAAANVCRDPKSGPHFQGGQHPDHPFLRSNKGPDLVALKFMDDETRSIRSLNRTAYVAADSSQRAMVPHAIRLIRAMAEIAIPWTHMRTTSSNKDLGLCSR